MYLQVGVKPGQLIAVAWRQAVDQVVGVAEVGQALHWVVAWPAGMVAAHVVLHHGVHGKAVLVRARVVGAVAGVW